MEASDGLLYGGKDEGARADRGRFDVPPYTITVRHDVNDTELPGLKVDYEKREISFDWRRMYSVFFREAEHMKRLWARSWELVYTRPFPDHITLFQAQ